MPRTRLWRHPRAFTLIELIVVILILGILAAVAAVAYTHFTDRAAATAAQSNLRQFASATLVHHTANQAPKLTRTGVLQALADSSVEVRDGLNAAAWTLYGHDHAPDHAGDFAIGFDHGEGTPVGDEAGTRAAVLTHASGNSYARIIVYGTHTASDVDGLTGSIPADATPEDVLEDPDLITPAPQQPDNPSNPGGGDEHEDTWYTGDLPIAAEISNFDNGGIREEALYVDTLEPVPAGTTDMVLVCTADPALPGEVVIETDVWEDEDFGGFYGWGMYGTYDHVPETVRVYDCTFTAQDSAGNDLASSTFTLDTVTGSKGWPEEPEDPDNPGDTDHEGPGGPSHPSDFGFLGVELIRHGDANYGWPEQEVPGVDWSTASVIAASVWAAPAGAALDGSGFNLTCTGGPYTDAPENLRNNDTAVLAWSPQIIAYDPADEFAPVECTVTAKSPSGTTLASRTMTLTAGSGKAHSADPGTQAAGDIALAPVLGGAHWAPFFGVMPMLEYHRVPSSMTSASAVCTQGARTPQSVTLSDDGWAWSASEEMVFNDDDGPVECEVTGHNSSGSVVRTWKLWDTEAAPFRTVGTSVM